MFGPFLQAYFKIFFISRDFKKDCSMENFALQLLMKNGIKNGQMELKMEKWTKRSTL